VRSARYVIGGAAAMIGMAAGLGLNQWRPVAVAQVAIAEAPVPLVKAETTPVKVKPKDPGGLIIPHKDKSIYERFETHRKFVPAANSAKNPKKPHQTASTNPDDKKSAQDIGPYRIQLGSFSTTQSAQKRWQEIRARHGDLIGSLQMVLERVQIRSKGTMVRLQAGPFKSAADVQKLCVALAMRKVGCLPVKS